MRGLYGLELNGMASRGTEDDVVLTTAIFGTVQTVGLGVKSERLLIVVASEMLLVPTNCGW